MAYEDVFVELQPLYDAASALFNLKHKALESELIKFVYPYYKRNDPFHQLAHAKDVAYRACSYAAADGVDIVSELLAAGYLHDIFAIHRKDHNTLAADFVRRSDELRELFLEYGICPDVVSLAIYHHRAKNMPKLNWASVPVSAYIAVADRRLNFRDAACICYMSAEEHGSFEGSLKYFSNRITNMLVINKQRQPPMLYRHRRDEVVNMINMVYGDLEQEVIKIAEIFRLNK